MAMPDEAIDQCETLYEAADGKKQKAAIDCFDNLALWHSFVAMTSHFSLPTSTLQVNSRNIALHSLNTFFHLSHWRLM